MNRGDAPTWVAKLEADEDAIGFWLHPDGRRLLIATLRNEPSWGVRCFDLQTGTLSTRAPLPAGGFHVTLDAGSPDVVHVVGTQWSNHGRYGKAAWQVRLDLVTLTVTREGDARPLPGELQRVRSDGSLVVLDGQWDRHSIDVLPPSSARRTAPRLDPSDRWLVHANRLGKFYIHDLELGGARHRRWYHGRGFNDVEVTPDGRQFFTVSADARELCAFSLPRGRLLRRWFVDEPLYGVHCEPDCEALVLICRDRDAGMTRLLRLDPNCERVVLLFQHDGDPWREFVNWIPGWVVVSERQLVRLYERRDRVEVSDDDAVAGRARAWLQGQLFVLSGEFQSVDKARLKRDLRACGANVFGALTRRTTALLLGGGEDTRKARRARVLGIPVIEESALPDALQLEYGCAPRRMWELLRALAEAQPSSFALEHLLCHLELWPVGSRRAEARAYVAEQLVRWPSSLRPTALARLDRWDRGE